MSIHLSICLSFYLERDLCRLSAHVIQEAEKSHDVSAISWRPRKASGHPEVWEAERADGIDASLSQKAWELEVSLSGGEWCRSSSIQAEREFDFL